MMSTLRNLRSGDLLARRLVVARNPWARGVGLLGRATVEPDQGLWIAGCNAVHTLGMRATLDLFFLDEAGTVLKVVRSARPHRPVFACRGATTVVELGAAEDRDVFVGDRLILE